MTAPLLRSTRKLLGMDLRELRRTVQLSEATLNQMERGKMKISKRSILKLRPKLRAACLRRSELLRQRAEELG